MVCVCACVRVINVCAYACVRVCAYACSVRGITFARSFVVFQGIINPHASFARSLLCIVIFSIILLEAFQGFLGFLVGFFGFKPLWGYNVIE